MSTTPSSVSSNEDDLGLCEGCPFAPHDAVLQLHRMRSGVMLLLCEDCIRHATMWSCRKCRVERDSRDAHLMGYSPAQVEAELCEDCWETASDDSSASE